MSLINDALKKAQMERHGKQGPASRHVGVTSASRGARRLSAIFFAVVALVLAGAGSAWLWVKQASSLPEVPVVAVKKKRVVPAPVAEPAPVVPVVKAPVIKPAPVAPVVVPVPVVVAPEPVAPVRDERVSNLLEAMDVGLVRPSTGRCVVNGAVIKIGDRVSYNPVIDFKAIRATTLVFTDKNGVEYEKRYK